VLKKNPKIAILLCTFNGSNFLEQQLDSIYAQDFKNWTLYVNDDGSEDSTITLLKNYKKKWCRGRILIRTGPKKGFCQNFLDIICDQRIQADLYFLCDQDDIWMPHKLSHTIKKISKLDCTKPVLYCARTSYISEDGKYILGNSILFRKKPSLKNALVQSISGGNTMAFNNNLKGIVRKFPIAGLVSHDWWLYILNELVNGKTFFDHEPTIFYRQHKNSLVGNNITFFAKFLRLKLFFSGTYREYMTIHLKTLQSNFSNISNIPKKNQKIVTNFSYFRDRGIKDRLSLIWSLGLYRQTLDTHLCLYIGALLRKL